jgi:hypothetical protein
MKIIILEDEQLDYAHHLLESRLASGQMNAVELYVASEFKKKLDTAPDIDFSKLGNMTLEKIGPGGISMGFDVDPNVGKTQAQLDKEETDRVRCEAGGPLPGVICKHCHATPCNCITTYPESA